MHIKRLFTTIAAIAPGAVEFHIHQVVMEFHNTIAKSTSARNRKREIPVSNRKNKGINATKIRKLVGSGGHASARIRPESEDNSSGCSFFKTTLI